MAGETINGAEEGFVPAHAGDDKALAVIRQPEENGLAGLFSLSSLFRLSGCPDSRPHYQLYTFSSLRYQRVRK